MPFARRSSGSDAPGSELALSLTVKAGLSALIGWFAVVLCWNQQAQPTTQILPSGLRHMKETDDEGTKGRSHHPHVATHRPVHEGRRGAGGQGYGRRPAIPRPMDRRAHRALVPGTGIGPARRGRARDVRANGNRSDQRRTSDRRRSRADPASRQGVAHPRVDLRVRGRHQRQRRPADRGADPPERPWPESPRGRGHVRARSRDRGRGRGRPGPAAPG